MTRVDVHNNRPKLTASSSTLQLNIISAPLGSVLPQAICRSLDQWQPEKPEPCPHELWLSLNLDDEEWKIFDKFTLRLSWPAFVSIQLPFLFDITQGSDADTQHPTQITMDIYDPTSLATFATKDSSSNMKKTRRKYARIQMVHSGVLTPGIVLDDNSRYNVPFILTLEPLYLGILPKSVVPVVFAIVVATLLGLPIAAKINGGLQNIMLEAKRDSIRQRKVD